MSPTIRQLAVRPALPDQILLLQKVISAGVATVSSSNFNPFDFIVSLLYFYRRFAVALDKIIEDARIQYMHDIGCDVAEMQSKGLYIPNVDAYARYKKPLKFGDEYSVEVSLVFFTGSRMIFDYKLFNNKNGELSATGRTTHCFATPELKPISIKHSNPDYYNRLRDNTVSPEDITIRR